VTSPALKASWRGGEALDLDRYLEDFYAEHARLTESFLKYERGQCFIEPGNPSWERFAAGDWEGALAAIRTELVPGARERFAKVRGRGLRSLRLRIVTRPLTPYVQWELHVLRAMAELGEETRVVSQEALRLPRWGALSDYPDLNFIDDRVMYHVRYDERGEPCGAVKYEDRALVAPARHALDALRETGEDLVRFFERLVAPLPAPDPRG
jgi:hypothetical protein